MTTTNYTVSGMSCGHCVASVTRELSALPGVQDVTVGLAPKATSTVTVTSQAPLPTDLVRGAIDEAGYELVGVDG